MLGKVAFLTLFLVVIANKRVRRIVGGVPAESPIPDDPVIYARFNGKSARIQGTLDFPHYVFKGLRYAEAPVGKLRFLRPQEVFLEGDVDARNFPEPCVQTSYGQVVGSEDCLFLNVFTPDLPVGTEGLPVVLWIHGGGFRSGSASQYGVRHLVGKRLVVVTIQYRLGSLGFLSSGSQELPGNVALWDMALATQWVRNYIGFFGGNPHRIVVMGHDTGASSALLMALSKIAKGISFSGIIAMSGSAVSQWATDDSPRITAQEIAEKNGCPINSLVVMVKCLQHLPAESLIKSDSSIQFQRLQSGGFLGGLRGRLGCAPVAEGHHDGRSLPPLIENTPFEDLVDENNPEIPLLTGVTKDETKKAVEGTYKSEIITNLRTIPDFVTKTLLPKLLTFDSKTSPLNFVQNYFTSKTTDLTESLSKISEATGDALFNAPAFLTASHWSKNNKVPAFLYRFDHSGKFKKGNAFLNGPLIGNSSTDGFADTVGHGDELSYLFDVQTLTGHRALGAPEHDEDVRVRDVFTTMIAEFARTGKITLNKAPVPYFTPYINSFVQIKEKPVLAKDFRFCEMALWLGLAQRMKSSACQIVSTIQGLNPVNSMAKLPKQGLGLGMFSG